MALVALKQFSGAYHMLICHVGPPYGTPGAPKRAHIGPERPFWGLWTSSDSPGEPDSVPSAALWSNWFGLIVTTYFDLVLGPFVAAKGPKGPFLAKKHLFGSIWVVWDLYSIEVPAQ